MAVTALWPCLLALVFLTSPVGRSAPAIPNLRELDSSDAMANRATKLSEGQMLLLRSVGREEISECLAYSASNGGRTAAAVLRTLRVKKVIISSREESALVVQGWGSCMCGGVGNCPFWLLSDEPHPAVLLSAIGIQSFAIRRNGSTDRFDFILGSHDSAIRTDIQTFSFVDRRYRRTDCASIQWSDWSGKKLDPPKVTVQKCRQLSGDVTVR